MPRQHVIRLGGTHHFDFTQVPRSPGPEGRGATPASTSRLGWKEDYPEQGDDARQEQYGDQVVQELHQGPVPPHTYAAAGIKFL